MMPAQHWSHAGGRGGRSLNEMVGEEGGREGGG